MKSLLNLIPIIILPSVLLGLSGLCSAETYIYKDKHGHWAFSDKPIPGLEFYELIEDEIDEEVSVKDLKSEFYQNYLSVTPIEEASLSVVTIKTPLGRGSGFFISENGYILTNKHVVRPSELEKLWRKNKEDFLEWEEDLKDEKVQLDREGLRLDLMKRSLDECNFMLKRPIYSIKEKKKWIESCRIKEQIYFDYEDLYLIDEKNYDSEKKKFDQAKKELFRKRSNAMFTRSFKILLKDESEHKVELITTSKKYDLALLKLNGYKTPSLKIRSSKLLPQGSRVFAIGLIGLSELKDKQKLELKESSDEEYEAITKIMIEGGLKNAVTSGIVTQLKSGHIFTDTAIYQGYSGGPLVDKQGRVVGINTMTIYKTELAAYQGFSVAISIDVAIEQFKEFLQPTPIESEINSNP